MTITEVMPLVESLPHVDKFKLMQLLLSQLAQEEGINLQTTENKKQDALWDMVGMVEGEDDNIAATSTERIINKDNPFCGMWKDRTDLENVDTYVRKLRQGRQF